MKKIFISYSSIDSAFGEKVESILIELGATVYRDKTFLTQEDEWRNQIDDRIKWCERFLFIHTANSISSDECNREILKAKGYSKQIHAFRFDKSSRLPILQEKQYIDYSTDDSLRESFIKELNLVKIEDASKKSNDDILKDYNVQVNNTYANLDILSKNIKPIESSYINIELQEGVEYNSKSSTFPSTTIYNYFHKRLLIITGNPGCGKSSFLKYLAYTYSRANSLYLYTATCEILVTLIIIH